LGLLDPARNPSRSTPILTPPRPRAWPLNSSHAPASAAPALAVAAPLYAPRDRCSKTKKMWNFTLPRFARRATPWTRARAPAHLYDSGTCVRRYGGCAVRCYRRHMLRRPFRCTHPSSAACVSKRHQRATLLASAGLGWPRCFAGGRGCCPLAPLTLSRRVPFFWLAGEILVEKIDSVFFPKNLGG
jgi:hypothetical protein